MSTIQTSVDLAAAGNVADARQPFPNSTKVYIRGSRPDIRVPMRQIKLSPTQTSAGMEENHPILVYDTSGPYTDPNIEISLEKGLPAIRDAWIAERGDTEELNDLISRYGRERRDDADLDALRFSHLRSPRRAKAGANVSQMHYAQAGIITP